MDEVILISRRTGVSLCPALLLTYILDIHVTGWSERQFLWLRSTVQCRSGSCPTSMNSEFLNPGMAQLDRSEWPPQRAGSLKRGGWPDSKDGTTGLVLAYILDNSASRNGHATGLSGLPRRGLSRGSLKRDWEEGTTCTTTGWCREHCTVTVGNVQWFWCWGWDLEEWNEREDNRRGVSR